MNRIATFASLLCTAAFVDMAAYAQDFTPIDIGGGGQTRRETQAYVGVAFQFGGQADRSPKIVAGVRSIEVESSDGVRGLDFNLWFDPKTGLDRIALSAIGGSRSAVANVGVGYDFDTAEPIVTAGVQAAHLRAGLDFALRSRQFVPYFELNTLNRPDAVASASSLSCSTPGYVLVTRDQLDGPGQGVFDFVQGAGLDVDGRACLDSSFLA